MRKQSFYTPKKVVENIFPPLKLGLKQQQVMNVNRQFRDGKKTLKSETPKPSSPIFFARCEKWGTFSKKICRKWSKFHGGKESLIVVVITAKLPPPFSLFPTDRSAPVGGYRNRILITALAVVTGWFHPAEADRTGELSTLLPPKAKSFDTFNFTNGFCWNHRQQIEILKRNVNIWQKITPETLCTISISNIFFRFLFVFEFCCTLPLLTKYPAKSC